jgi:hypothetical protein
MSSKVELRIDWCSHDAARYAVEKWHYSHRMPKSKLAKFGVWENGKFVGAVIYGVGAGNSTNGRRWGLGARWDMCELVRVALNTHATPTSRIVAITLKLIHKASPKLRLITSFADTQQGHLGVLYQAGGWLYLGGKEETSGGYRVNGQIFHPRSLHDRYGKGGQSIPWLRAHVDPKAERLRTPVKHHYVYPLDEEMRTRMAQFVKPYPKRPPSGGLPADQVGQDGVDPDLAAPLS